MAERPVECGHCKKPACIQYKEMANKTVACTEMCGECPVLEAKLHGLKKTEGKEGIKETSSLCCGTCGLTLESIKMGNPLGCSGCYEVFGDLLVHELIERNLIPAHLQHMVLSKTSPFLHIGKTPQSPKGISPKNRLTSLNEALNEALQKENYEQAAWLRDQIKKLTDKK